MGKRLKFREMTRFVRQSLKQAPDCRTGANIQCEIADAGLGAFSVFYMQSPSFLAHQQDMQKRKGQNNAQSLFDMETIPKGEETYSHLGHSGEWPFEVCFWFYRTNRSEVATVGGLTGAWSWYTGFSDMLDNISYH